MTGVGSSNVGACHDITLRGVTVSYGDKPVLDGLDLTLMAGTVTALMGPNGAGKTTVARVILGLVATRQGTVTGREGTGRDGAAASVVFQENRLVGHLNAIDNVALVRAHPRGAEALAAARRELAALGMTGTACEVPVSILSGGQRRRVAIARALAATADLVVLDEPFTGIDAQSRQAVMSRVREGLAGRTALLITHSAQEAVFFGARIVRLPARSV